MSLQKEKSVHVGRQPALSNSDLRPAHMLTKGIAVHSYCHGDTQYHILDMGGHDDFAASHTLFIGQGRVPVINMIVVNCTARQQAQGLPSQTPRREDIRQTLLKWAAFYASCCAPSSDDNKRRQPIIVVASHGPEASTADQESVYAAYSQAEKDFGRCLEFIGGPIFMDCRKPREGGMRTLRTCITQVKDYILKVLWST